MKRTGPVSACLGISDGELVVSRRHGLDDARITRDTSLFPYDLGLIRSLASLPRRPIGQEFA